MGYGSEAMFDGESPLSILFRSIPMCRYNRSLRHRRPKQYRGLSSLNWYTLIAPDLLIAGNSPAGERSGPKRPVPSLERIIVGDCPALRRKTLSSVFSCHRSSSPVLLSAKPVQAVPVPHTSRHFWPLYSHVLSPTSTSASKNDNPAVRVIRHLKDLGPVGDLLVS